MAGLRVFDPRLATGLRDDGMLHLRCIAARAPKWHHGPVPTAGDRVFAGGDGHNGTDGWVSGWSASTGAVQSSRQLSAPVTCLCVVETATPVAVLRPKNRARKPVTDAFGCESMVWAGQADGQLAVLSGDDLSIRTTLGAHQGEVACVCTPGGAPSSATPGAAVVLSGGTDGATRIWDARNAACLRQIPGGGAALRAILPVWAPASEHRGERCRVWSTDADQTLCVWEPQQRPPTGQPHPVTARRGGASASARPSLPSPPVHPMSLDAGVTSLAASRDGTLVCAAAAADGVLVFDGNARLRARLACSASSADVITALHVVGRGRQLWTGGGSDGGIALWDRLRPSSGSAATGTLSWNFACSRRLPCPSRLIAFTPCGSSTSSHLWGACYDGTLHVWMVEAAVSDAIALGAKQKPDAASSAAAAGARGRRRRLRRGGGVPCGRAARDLAAAPQAARGALAELRKCRDDYSALLARVGDGQAQLEGDRAALARVQDKLALALHDETVGRIDAEERRAALVTEVEALRYELSTLGQSRDQALALKAAREHEVSRLKKVEAGLNKKQRQDEEVGRQLAEVRVQLQGATSEKKRLAAELKHTRHELLELKRAGRDEARALEEERDDLAAGLAQRSAETGRLTEALRACEASEAAAKREAEWVRARLEAFEEESARMKHEREQMRSANARMQALLGRLREQMGGMSAGGAGVPPLPPPASVRAHVAEPALMQHGPELAVGVSGSPSMWGRQP